MANARVDERAYVAYTCRAGYTAHARNDTTERRGAHTQNMHVRSVHVQTQPLLQVECDCVSFL